MMWLRIPGGCWIVFVSATFSVGAANQAASQEEVAVVNAARAGDAHVVQALLEKGADVNVPEPDGTTALHWAVYHDDLNTVELLLHAGAQPRAVTRYGVTPLYLACINGNAVIIERLLAAGADPNAALADGETALMTAARTGNVEALKVLVANRADINAKERRKGQTALMWAAAANNAAAVRTLVAMGADVKASSTEPAGTEFAGGTAGFTAYLFAVRGGAIEAAQALVALGVDVNEALPDGTPAFILAIMNGHFELAGVVLDLGADPNAVAEGCTPLHQIAYTRRPNTGFNNPGAIPTGKLDSLDLVKKLVQHGANINARQTAETAQTRDSTFRSIMSRLGATPFLLAAKHADVPLMRVLLALGADPTITTFERIAPLAAAAGVGIWAVGESPGTNEEAFEAVKLMLELLGADPDAVDDNGDTAMHGAALRGANEIVQLLADKDARLDVRNKPDIRREGSNVSDLSRKEATVRWTPLMIADGVHYANSLRRQEATAALIRRLLKERGLPVSEPEPITAAVGVGQEPAPTTQNPR